MNEAKDHPVDALIKNDRTLLRKLKEGVKRHALTRSGDRPRYDSSHLTYAILIAVIILDVPGVFFIPLRWLIICGKYLLFGSSICVTYVEGNNSDENMRVRWLLLALTLCLWAAGFTVFVGAQIFHAEINNVDTLMHDILYAIRDMVAIVVFLGVHLGKKSLSILKIALMLSLLSVLIKSVYYQHVLTIGQSIRLFNTGICQGIIAIALLVAALTRLIVARQESERKLCLVFLAALCGYIFSVTVVPWHTYSNNLPEGGVSFVMANLSLAMFIMSFCWAKTLLTWSSVSQKVIITQLSEVLAAIVLVAALTSFCYAINNAAVAEITRSAIELLSILVYIAHSFVVKQRSMRMLWNAETRAEKLAGVVSIDPLTGVLNRRGFDDALLLSCKVTQDMQEENLYVALLMIDVDYFKEYNDLLGHAGGDHCLQSVARLLQACLLFPDDRVARYGGDEMAVILTRSTVDEIVKIADTIRARAWNMNLPHPKSPYGRVTLSIGIGFHGDCLSLISPSSVLNAADSALYQAKRLGKNVVSVGHLPERRSNHMLVDLPLSSTHV